MFNISQSENYLFILISYCFFMFFAHALTGLDLRNCSLHRALPQAVAFAPARTNGRSFGRAFRANVFNFQLHF